MAGTDIYGQGVPYSLLSESPDVQVLGKPLADAIGRLGAKVFLSASNRGAVMTGGSAPTAGMITYLVAEDRFDYWNGSAWVGLDRALPGLPRGVVGWVRYDGGSTAHSGLGLVDPAKFTVAVSATRRYRIDGRYVWAGEFNDSANRSSIRYAVGGSINSDGSGTTELTWALGASAVGSAAQTIAMQHEFNGPATGSVTFGLYIQRAGANNVYVYAAPATLSLHDIGAAI
ncbi:hypothetical protein [Embleya sp. NPDC020630]|uniref:hypothetical protein n=1 Tax=Embleya sp. NPDC020630 TaxID=3363979 RepID=UPI0037AF11AA